MAHHDKDPHSQNVTNARALVTAVVAVLTFAPLTMASPLVGPRAATQTPSSQSSVSLSDAIILPSPEATSTRKADLPLGGSPQSSDPNAAVQGDPASPLTVMGQLWKSILPLAVVLSAIFALTYMAKRIAKNRGDLASAVGAGGRAPSGVLEVLGRYPVQRGLTLVLLRVDRRILLMSQSAGGKAGPRMETLSEITDADEVASLMLKTRDDAGESADRHFRAALHEMERRTDQEIEAIEPSATRQRIISEEGDRTELLSVPQATQSKPIEIAQPLHAEQTDEPQPIESSADPVEDLRRRLDSLRARGAFAG